LPVDEPVDSLQVLLRPDAELPGIGAEGRQSRFDRPHAVAGGGVGQQPRWEWAMSLPFPEPLERGEHVGHLANGEAMVEGIAEAELIRLPLSVASVVQEE